MLCRPRLTNRLASKGQEAAKKAREEAERIAAELARKKKAEHDAKVAQAALDQVNAAPRYRPHRKGMLCSRTSGRRYSTQA